MRLAQTAGVAILALSAAALAQIADPSAKTVDRVTAAHAKPLDRPAHRPSDASVASKRPG